MLNDDARSSRDSSFSGYKTFWLESLYEILKLWRTPAFALPTILFPVLFYFLFGVVLAAKFQISGIAAKALIANFGTMAVMATSLFGFGVRIAVERGQGWLEMKRVSPAPILTYFGAKLVASLTFATGTIIVLLILGNSFGNSQMTWGQNAAMSVALLFGCVPFSALGLAIGSFVEGSAAPAVLNIIMWPLAFLSGLWIPLFLLPGTLQRIAPFLPPFQLAQLAESTFVPLALKIRLIYVLALGGLSLCCLLVAAIRFRSEER
jgi:ABC-2 type transport system permease protein